MTYFVCDFFLLDSKANIRKVSGATKEQSMTKRGKADCNKMTFGRKLSGVNVISFK